MNRICVVGSTASGKSTFAAKLGKARCLKHIELDDLAWLDDWQLRSREDLVACLAEAIESASAPLSSSPLASSSSSSSSVTITCFNGFIIDGNYRATEELRWRSIDTLIWIDMPFHVNLYRSISRALYRAFTKKQLWEHSNNRESFRKLFSTDSIILWLFKTYTQNREKFLHLQSTFAVERPEIHFVHLRSPREVEDFLRANGFADEKKESTNKKHSVFLTSKTITSFAAMISVATVGVVLARVMRK